MHLFTDRNVFNHIYKSKLLSHYFYEHVSSSKKTLRICDVFFYQKQHGFLRTSLCTKQNTEGSRHEL